MDPHVSCRPSCLRLTHGPRVAQPDRDSPPPGGAVPSHDTEHAQRPGLVFPPNPAGQTHTHFVDNTPDTHQIRRVPSRFGPGWQRFPWSALIAIVGTGAVHAVAFVVDADPLLSTLVVAAAGLCGLFLIVAQAMSGAER